MRALLALFLLSSSLLGQSCQQGMASAGTVALVGQSCMQVAPIPLAGTGAPTAACSATQNVNALYVQADAKAGSRLWACTLNAATSGYEWSHLIGPVATGTTGSTTAGLLALNACQTLTATVAGSIPGTNFALASPTNLPTTLASLGNLEWTAVVSAANTVTVNVCARGVAVTTSAVTFGVLVF